MPFQGVISYRQRLRDIGRFGTKTINKLVKEGLKLF